MDRAFLSMVAIEELFHEVHCPRSERIKPRATSFLNAQASLAPTHVFSESIFSASVFSESVFSESVFSDSVSSESVFSESIFSKSLFSESVFSKSVLQVCKYFGSKGPKVT